MHRKKYPRGILILIAVALILGVLSLFRSDGKKGSIAGNAPASGIPIVVYFLDNNNPATTTSCGITRAVVRTIGKKDPYTDSIKELFRGPTAAEKSDGLSTVFTQPGSDLEPLDTYFNKVSVQDGVAYIDFDEPALSYLNSPACMQEAVKMPIESTLKQFPDVDQVEYTINGTVFRDWDA